MPWTDSVQDDEVSASRKWREHTVPSVSGNVYRLRLRHKKGFRLSRATVLVWCHDNEVDRVADRQEALGAERVTLHEIHLVRKGADCRSEQAQSDHAISDVEGRQIAEPLTSPGIDHPRHHLSRIDHLAVGGEGRGGDGPRFNYRAISYHVL